jgi:tetratricopeptide (TPR) repeat protein
VIYERTYHPETEESKRQSKGEDLLLQAEACEAVGDFKEAVRLYKSAYRIWPDLENKDYYNQPLHKLRNF